MFAGVCARHRTGRSARGASRSTEAARSRWVASPRPQLPPLGAASCQSVVAREPGFTSGLDGICWAGWRRCPRRTRRAGARRSGWSVRSRGSWEQRGGLRGGERETWRGPRPAVGGATAVRRRRWPHCQPTGGAYARRYPPSRARKRVRPRRNRTMILSGLSPVLCGSVTGTMSGDLHRTGRLWPPVRDCNRPGRVLAVAIRTSSRAPGRGYAACRRN